jgi:hypothetical protein
MDLQKTIPGRSIYQGKGDRIRDEVVRPCIEDYDAADEVADMLNDYHKA